MIQLSYRAKLLKPSPTLALAAKARELKAAGKDVVSLTVGEPDWPTLQVANRAGIAAIESNFSKYTAANGMPELRQAIADWTNHQLKSQFTTSNICVTSGAKFGIHAALQMVINDGDEVLIPSPYWVSYPTMVELSGGTPKIISCDESVDFKLQFDQLEKSITPKTKALILCSPSNPTGKVHTKEELNKIAQVLKRNPHVTVISDDIYNLLVFGPEERAAHLLDCDPTLSSQMILINGASKAFSMTGWRLGWCVGPTDVINKVSDYCSQTTSNPSSISQKAALAALKEGQKEIQESQKQLRQRKTFAEKIFGDLKTMKLSAPQGAFYLWMDVRGAFGKSYNGRRIQTSAEIAQILLDDFFVATVPGNEFGCEGYLRLSFAASEIDLKKAAERFQKFETGI